MPNVSVITQSPQDTPSRRSVGFARANLRNCGCLALWERFNHLSLEGGRCELAIRRLRRCIEEQCWAPGDIVGVVLTGRARHEPFPDVVSEHLANKLKNARSIKNEAFESIREQRLTLENGHRSCYGRAKRDLNVLFGVTKANRKILVVSGERDIDNEINSLIRGSVWSKLVDVSRVRNLTED